MAIHYFLKQEVRFLPGDSADRHHTGRELNGRLVPWPLFLYKLRFL